MNNRQAKKKNRKLEQQAIKKMADVADYVDVQKHDEDPDNPHMKTFRQVIIFIFIMIGIIVISVVVARSIGYFATLKKTASLCALVRFFTELMSTTIALIAIYYLCVEWHKTAASVDAYNLMENRRPMMFALWLLAVQAVIMVILIVKNCIVPLFKMAAKGSFTNVSITLMNNAIGPIIISALMIVTVFVADWIRTAEKTAVINFSSLALAVVSLLVSLT